MFAFIKVIRRATRWLISALLLLLVLFVFLPMLLIGSMRWIDPVTSMFMLQRQYELWREDATAEVMYEWVDAEQISPKMMLAVVAAEDQKFPLHFGFDLEAIEKAMMHNRQGRKIRGASTITQQVAKNIFLWPSRSWVRKGMEVYFTLLIEALWSKQRIVEVYVNIAQFDDNVFGVGAASRQFFHKPAAQLNTRETALLAAVLPSPKRYSVIKPSAYVLRRARWIEQQMYGLGEAYVLTGVVPVKQYRQHAAPVTDEDMLPLLQEPLPEPLDDEFMSEPVDETMIIESETPGAIMLDPQTLSDEVIPVLPDEMVPGVDQNVISEPAPVSEQLP